MKPFVSPETMAALETEAFERGELLANVMLPHATVCRVKGPVVDEHGRSWVLPGDSAGLHSLYTQYVRTHGRLSSAVDGTFLRHGQLNQLRALVLRCVEGEAINLAARALALGPVPRTPAPATWPRDQPWVHDVIDEQRREQVEREEQRMRLACYAD